MIDPEDVAEVVAKHSHCNLCAYGIARALKDKFPKDEVVWLKICQPNGAEKWGWEKRWAEDNEAEK
jgi:hypothetical protein